MAKLTYAEVVQQIQRLQEQAENLKRQEVDGVIARIREAVAVYNLTPEDIFGGRSAKSRGGPASARRAPSAKRGARAERGVAFSDGKGNTWGGRGPRPRWLRDALAQGASLESFRTGGAAREGVSTASEAAKAPGRGKASASPARKAGRGRRKNGPSQEARSEAAATESPAAS